MSASAAVLGLPGVQLRRRERSRCCVAVAKAGTSQTCRLDPAVSSKQLFSVETTPLKTYSFPHHGEQALTGCILKESDVRSLGFYTEMLESISQRQSDPCRNVMAFPPLSSSLICRNSNRLFTDRGFSKEIQKSKRHASLLRSFPKGQSIKRIA